MHNDDLPADPEVVASGGVERTDWPFLAVQIDSRRAGDRHGATQHSPNIGVPSPSGTVYRRPNPDQNGLFTWLVEDASSRCGMLRHTQESTHNPLVAGSIPAGPTEQSAVGIRERVGQNPTTPFMRA